MKKLLILTILTSFLIGCTEKELMAFDQRLLIDIDYQSQEVNLTTNNAIYHFGFVYTKSDSETMEVSYDKDIKICKGDWFAIIFTKSNRHRLTVKVEENLTENDRCVKVYARDNDFEDYITIHQKSKPAE